MDRNTLAGAFDFYVKGISTDGRISESIIHDLISEQRDLLGVKAEISLNQVVDFSPLERVLKEMNIGK